MKRLTNRNIEIPSPRPENADYWRRVHLKLAAYEDADEAGLLIRLPCKFGETCYEIIRGKIVERPFLKNDFPFLYKIYFSREEAEDALKGENNG